MCRLFCTVLIFLGLTFFCSAQHLNTDTVGVKTVSDNLYNKPLFGDSLASSFVIVIKKEVKPRQAIE